MNKNRLRLQKYLISLLIVLFLAILMCILDATDAAYGAESYVSDLLYQHAHATDGEIVIIGMDQTAVEQLGQMPWPRSVMAETIDLLNSSEETRPAVIGIDVLYSGISADPEEDRILVDSVERAGNVVVAAAAGFGNKLIVEDGEFRMNTQAINYWEQPFAELAKIVEYGHINAMYDADGILRHGLGKITVPIIGEVRPFARVVYEKYCEETGQTPKPWPENEKFFYIPFSAERDGYCDHLSITDILNGEIPLEQFAGKIVLIGPYAPGMQDEYHAAIRRGETLYGVEVQANLIDAFRSGKFPKELSGGARLAVVFFSCILLGLIVERRRLWQSALGLIGSGLLWTLVCIVSYRLGLVLPTLYVYLTLPLTFVCSVIASYLMVRARKNNLERCFGYYIDPAILRQLMADGVSIDSLRGKERDIAVMFVDIRGFTSICEKLTTLETVEMLNEFLSYITDCCVNNKGTVDKYVGDCVMAFWNAPVEQENAIQLACSAAMDIVNNGRVFSAQMQERFGVTVRCGVGIAYGSAIVGNIGAPKRKDYTAIGDTVNCASRLEEQAPGGEVYITRSIADYLGDTAETELLPEPLALKGKAEPVEVFRLKALR